MKQSNSTPALAPLHPGTQFHLRKWYLDAADHEGNVFIGYWLRLSWREHQVSFYQHLRHTTRGGVHSQTGIAMPPEPSWPTQDQLQWNTDHVQGSWISLARPLKETLLHTARGEVVWHCTQPKADARIALPDLSFQGWGYTECLDLTMPVWELPFHELYWGRCHTENHYLVWIRWEGDSARRVLWHNGIAQEGAIISDMLVEGGGVHLKLPKDVTLRQGNLLTTTLQPFKHLLGFAPLTALTPDETKWYGNTTLQVKDSAEPATVIFEKVLW